MSNLSREGTKGHFGVKLYTVKGVIHIFNHIDKSIVHGYKSYTGHWSRIKPQGVMLLCTRCTGHFIL